MSSFCNVYQQVLKNIPAKLNFLEYNEATNMKENILTLFDLKDTHNASPWICSQLIAWQ